ncbi:hypothetical protein K1T71_006151 [Dendrolimus kikuchii]|uniref:Uncharacterized protein n=1 Tax=Dendrolimus kikuchii TaxID=765133 RepID=A0ACC1D332_9NEOP|nr:hypothetical protein K1T71_006151 [Dendrolimus kikuchii]
MALLDFYKIVDLMVLASVIAVIHAQVLSLPAQEFSGMSPYGNFGSLRSVPGYGGLGAYNSLRFNHRRLLNSRLRSGIPGVVFMG